MHISVEANTYTSSQIQLRNSHARELCALR